MIQSPCHWRYGGEPFGILDTGSQELLFHTQVAGYLLFKGGTSLSKGWDFINRFSEDIDLALDRDFFLNETIDDVLSQIDDQDPTVIYVKYNSLYSSAAVAEYKGNVTVSLK